MHIYQPTPEAALRFPEYRATNDIGLLDGYYALRDMQRETPPSPEDCAVIVGTGGLLSMADALPPVLYMTDTDTRVFEWMGKAVGALRAAETPREYKMTVPDTGLWFYGERSIFVEKHFLSSQDRFEAVREAVLGMMVTYIAIDYSKPDDIAGLADQLRAEEKELSVFNPTNMHRHIARKGGQAAVSSYLEGLEFLPWASNVRILSSAVELVSPRSLPVQDTLEGYATLAVLDDAHGTHTRVSQQRPERSLKRALRRQST